MSEISDSILATEARLGTLVGAHARRLRRRMPLRSDPIICNHRPADGPDALTVVSPRYLQPMRLEEGPDRGGHLLVGLLAQHQPVVRVRPVGLVLGAEPGGEAFRVALRLEPVETLPAPAPPAARPTGTPASTSRRAWPDSAPIMCCTRSTSAMVRSGLRRRSCSGIPAQPTRSRRKTSGTARSWWRRAGVRSAAGRAGLMRTRPAIGRRVARLGGRRPPPPAPRTGTWPPAA